MPYFFDRPHYQAIAHLLIAGEYQARVVSNASGLSVEVVLTNESRAIWSNQGRTWACSIVSPEGDVTVEVTNLPIDSAPEVVADFIVDSSILEIEEADA